MRSSKIQQQKEIRQYKYWENCLLGKGTSAKVYRGQEKNFNLSVALKLINQNQVQSQVFSYLLKNQIRACKMLQHPNLLRTFDVYRENGYCYIITELYQGGNLRQLIKAKGKLSQFQALWLFWGILNGYSQILKNKIIHRDLKTDNVLLTEENSPVIIDFGFCQFFDSPKKPEIPYNVGTPGYMAPQAYNRNEYSEKSEVWSLGVILHEMVTGSMLKQQTKNRDKYFKDLEKKKYPQFASTSFENKIVQELLFKCLAVNTNERASFSEIKNLVDDWKIKQIKQKQISQEINPVKENINTQARQENFPQPKEAGNISQKEVSSHKAIIEPNQNNLFLKTTSLTEESNIGQKEEIFPAKGLQLSQSLKKIKPGVVRFTRKSSAPSGKKPKRGIRLF